MQCGKPPVDLSKRLMAIENRAWEDERVFQNFSELLRTSHLKAEGRSETQHCRGIEDVLQTLHQDTRSDVVMGTPVLAGM